MEFKFLSVPKNIDRKASDYAFTIEDTADRKTGKEIIRGITELIGRCDTDFATATSALAFASGYMVAKLASTISEFDDADRNLELAGLVYLKMVMMYAGLIADGREPAD